LRNRPKVRSAWIYYKLRLNRMTGAEIGRKLGVSTSLVCQVIRGEWPNPRVRRAVAEALGLPYKKVWREEDRGH